MCLEQADEGADSVSKLGVGLGVWSGRDVTMTEKKGRGWREGRKEEGEEEEGGGGRRREEEEGGRGGGSRRRRREEGEEGEEGGGRDSLYLDQCL